MRAWSAEKRISAYIKAPQHTSTTPPTHTITHQNTPQHINNAPQTHLLHTRTQHNTPDTPNTRHTQNTSTNITTHQYTPKLSKTHRKHTNTHHKHTHIIPEHNGTQQTYLNTPRHTSWAVLRLRTSLLNLLLCRSRGFV
jgi:hypothetical protein